MRYWVPFFLCWLLFGGAAVGQTVTIRSGEHPKFTRLVLYFNAPVMWQLGRVPEGYALRVDPGTFTYDTSGIYDFIPRSRIADVRPDAAGLIFPVQCRCHAAAFEHSPGILVIDIKDGPPPPGSRFEAILVPLPSLLPEVDQATGPAAASLAQVGPGDVPAETTPAREGEALPTAAPAKLAFPITFPKDPVARALPQPMTDAPPLAKEPDPLRARLSEQLGRAVSQGLVTAVSQPPVPVVRADPDSVGALSVPSASDGNFRLRTALDLAQEDLGVEEDLPDLCLPSELFRVFQRTQTEPAALALAQARSALMEDLVTPTSAAVLNLAQTYAYLGFGAELRNLLTEFPQPGEAAYVLLELSGLIDAPGIATTDGLRDQVSCETGAALWGLLAYGPEIPTRTVNDKAIQRAVSALPLQLRRHLVPAVSEKLRVLGLAEAAGRLRDTLVRVSDDPDGELLVETALAEASDTIAPATLAGLERTATGNSEVAARAQAEVLRHDRRSGTPVSAARRDEITAQIHEMKGTEAGAELLSAYIGALNGAGMSREALTYLTRKAGSEFVAPEDLADLIDQTFAGLAQDADDGTFLEIAVTFPPSVLPASPGIVTSREVADRLFALGFPAQAKLFERDGPPPMDTARRLVLARNALAQGQSMEALARVAQLDDPDSRALRAEALAAAGANRAAAALLEAEGDTSTAALQAWMGGDWATADRLLPEGPRKALARDLEAAERQSSESAGGAGAAGTNPSASARLAPPNLTDGRQLIDVSTALRTTLQTFLASDSPSN